MVPYNMMPEVTLVCNTSTLAGLAFTQWSSEERQTQQQSLTCQKLISQNHRVISNVAVLALVYMEAYTCELVVLILLIESQCRMIKSLIHWFGKLAQMSYASVMLYMLHDNPALVWAIG